jgi:hypothetical protein
VHVLLNYSEALLDVPEGVAVQTLNPAVALLSMFGAQARNGGSAASRL